MTLSTALRAGPAAALLLTCVAALAQTPPPSGTSVAALSAVPNVAATIGTQAALKEGLRFCTLDEPATLAQAARDLAASGRKPVLIGWRIAETPGHIGKVVAVSNASHPACQPVQTLPAGGVQSMQLEVPYAVIDKAPDWSAGFTALVMAVRDEAMPAADYVPRLKRHVNLVASLFESKGLDGYLVYAGADHEWAYLHWPDEDTAKRAFATPDGATGPKDSRSIQRPVGTQPVFAAALK